MNATTNNRNQNDNRNTKRAIVIGALVIAVILLILCLRSCGSNGNNAYHMILNGDNPFEIALNDQFVDPGVTFVDDDNNPVSSEKQAELEQEMTITGLEQIDTSVSGEYPVEYSYEDQTLERLVKVLAGEKDTIPENNSNNNNQSNDDENKGNTESGNDVSGTQNPTETPEATQQPSTTTKPGTTDPGTSTNPGGTTPPPGDDDEGGNGGGGNKPVDKEVYVLPSNVTFNNRTLTYDGNEHNITVSNLPYGIRAVYYNNSGTDAGRYDATVVYVLSDFLKTRYSSVEPASMNATLTIRQAMPTYTVPTNLTAKVGQTLADVKLPKGFTFEKSLTTSVGPEGANVFWVTYTPSDTVNYKTVQHIEVIIKVTNPGGGNDDNDKVVFNLPSNVTFDNRTVTYNGNSYSITVDNIPTGINVTYVNNSGTDVGTYNAKAYFTISDELKDKYSSVKPSSMTATLIIEKATPRYTTPTGLTAKVGQTLANVKLPKGFAFEDPLTTSVGTVGSHVFKVTYTPDDTKNFKTVSGIDVIINVTDSDPGPGPGPVKPVYKLPANVTFANRTETYDGTEYAITAENVPTGIIASYSNATRTDAGSQTATVVFALSESLAQNYSGVEPSSMTAVLTINPATPVYTVPTGLKATEGQTLADVRSQLGTGFSFEDPLTTSVGAPGDNEFTVTFKPDSTNYKVVTGIKVTIHVTKAPDPTKPKFTMPANITFDDRTETYTGTEYVITAENVPAELSVSYSNNRRTNAGSQLATATFTLSDKGLESYSGIEGSTVLTATLKIEPATPSYTVPTGITAVEGQTLADIAGQLGKGFSFEDPLSTSVGTVGTKTVKVTYMPDDTVNYKTVTGIDVTITVTQKPDPTKPKYTLPANIVFADRTETYDGTEYAITAENVPDILSVSYSNNRRSNAGDQIATATFTLNSKGLESYSGIEGDNTKTATLKIEPATPSYTVPTGLTAVEGQTLADVAGQLGTGFSFESGLDTPVGAAGDREFTVTYNPGSSNYKTVTGIKVTIRVTAAKMTYLLPSNVSFPDVEGVYGQQAVFEALVVNLPDHIVATTYTTNTRSDAGTQKARVDFSIKPEYADTYDSVSPSYMEATITVHQAVPSYTAPTGLTAKVGQTLADVAGQLGEGFAFEDPLETSVGGAGQNKFTVSYTPTDTNYKKIEGIAVTIEVSYDGDDIDRSELEAAIRDAEAVSPFDWTEESYEAFTEAYTEAKKMSENTQDDVDNKTDAIRAAIELLEETEGGSGTDIPTPLDRAALEAAINDAEAISEFDWSEESYAEFAEAYATAKGKPESTQDEINAKTQAIRDAIALLKKEGDSGTNVSTPLDTSALESAISDANAISEFDWSSESYAAFFTAYTAAMKMPQNTQDEVDAKTQAIQNAIALLEEEGDSSSNITTPSSDEQGIGVTEEEATAETTAETEESSEETVTEESSEETATEESSEETDFEESEGDDTTTIPETTVVIEDAPPVEIKQDDAYVEKVVAEEKDISDEPDEENESKQQNDAAANSDDESSESEGTSEE